MVPQHGARPFDAEGLDEHESGLDGRRHRDVTLGPAEYRDRALDAEKAGGLGL